MRDALSRFVARFALSAKAYSTVFGSQAGKTVLVDLAHFCFAYQTTFVPDDPYASARNQGRREVFLAIMRKANMNPGQIEAIAQQAFEERNKEKEHDDNAASR